MTTRDQNFIDALERMLNAAQEASNNWPEDDGNKLPKSLDIYPFKQSLDDLAFGELKEFVESARKELSLNEYEITFADGRPAITVRGESVSKALVAAGHGDLMAKEFEWKEIE